MMLFLIEPFQFAFMQRGMLAGILVGMVCAVIGCFVILRGMAFLGDALAHSILPGVAISYLLGGNLLVGALAAAILVSILISLFSRSGVIKEDTSIGILFAASLALGIAIISSIRSYAADLSHILFGNILGVSSQDLSIIIALTSIILVSLVFLYRPFVIVAFDPILAQTLKLRTNLLRGVLLVQLAVTIVISLQTVGVSLVTAMLVTPPATAYLLTKRLPAMMLLSAIFGMGSSVAGLFVSYYMNIASGASIVLVSTVIFLIVYLISPRNDFLRKILSKKGTVNG